MREVVLAGPGAAGVSVGLASGPPIPMTEKPRLSFWQIWNMSFGFLGIQFGWGLQMANMSAIYQYLGHPRPGVIIRRHRKTIGPGTHQGQVIAFLYPRKRAVMAEEIA